MVATFVRSGYQTGQEVNFDLLFFFGTSQTLSNPDDELYWFREGRDCIFSFLKNEFFYKDATKLQNPVTLTTLLRILKQTC